MDPIQSLLLGIVQGITEFLPISSSGHLLAVPWLLGWPHFGLTFDVALHLGTTAALIVFFWRQWLELLQAFARGLSSATARQDVRWKLIWMLAVGTVPAGLVGILFEDQIEQWLRHPENVGVALIGFGAIMWLVDRFSQRSRKLLDLGYRDALLIGIAQTLALAPGVSRSGATITAGLALGMNREAAARFSFLLATPITLGAGLYKTQELLAVGVPPSEALSFAIGIFASFVTGILAIGFLLRFLQRHSLTTFVVYRFGLGALILGLAAFG